MSEDKQESPWVLIGLDDDVARKQGFPNRVPVPREQFEGMADKGLQIDKVREWIQDFLATSDVGQDATWRRRNSNIVYRLEAFVDKGPQLDKAQKAFEEKDYEKAAKLLKRVTIMDDEDYAAKLNYASALAAAGDVEKALKAYKRIRDVFGDDPEFHLSMAQLYADQGDTEKATEALVLGLEAQPDHRPCMDALAKLGVLVRIYEDPRDAASLVYVRADSVLDYLNERWDSEERDSDYYLEQLTYHEGERRYHVALEAAERAIKAADGILEVAELGKVANLRNMGRNDDAVTAAAGYVERAPSSAGAHVELARSLKAARKADEAGAEIEKALECDPGDLNAIALRFWPEDDQDMQQVADAIPALTAFAEAHAELAGVWRSLARAHLVAGAEDEALELFKKAVELAPEDEDLRSEWWGELARYTRYQEILDDAAKLGDMNDRSWMLRWNEAEAYRGVGKQMEARGCYMSINADESLHVDIRKRAKRTVAEMGMPPGMGGEPAGPAAEAGEGPKTDG